MHVVVSLCIVSKKYHYIYVHVTCSYWMHNMYVQCRYACTIKVSFMIILFLTLFFYFYSTVRLVPIFLSFVHWYTYVGAYVHEQLQLHFTCYQLKLLKKTLYLLHLGCLGWDFHRNLHISWDVFILVYILTFQVLLTICTMVRKF